jgi:RNA polymerase sigma factor (sigma-70 family)
MTFDEIYRQYRDRAINLALSRYGLIYDDAEAIATDAFMLLKATMDKGKKVRNLDGWLRRQIAICAYDLLKRKDQIKRGGKGRLKSVNPCRRVTFLDIADRHNCYVEFENTHDVALVLTQLTEENRRMVKLSYMEEINQETVARMFGISTRSLERRLRSLRKRLSRSLS